MSDDGNSGTPHEVDESWLAAVQQRLDAIREGRGYVLASHAMLAVSDPDLLAKYEQVYRAITYTCRALSPFEKNFVWLVVIACVQTPTGAHHVQDFINAAGTLGQVEAAASLAMLALGAGMLDTAAGSWRSVLPGYSPLTVYRNALERVVAGHDLPVGLVHMALTAGQACRGDWDKVVLHIHGAKQAGVSDDALAEALSVVILPAGNPAFVQACAIWRDLIRNGEVAVSPAYRFALGKT